jgi:hypothetical protein
VEIYGRVRRAVGVEGRSQRAVARGFGLSRETVRKMLQYAVPPRLPATAADQAAQAGAVAGRNRRHFGRPQAEASQAAPYGEADLRAAKRRARFHRRLAECRKRRERRRRRQTETIGERFERDRAAILLLPAAPYEACEKITARVSSLPPVRHRSNDYSVQNVKARFTA